MGLQIQASCVTCIMTVHKEPWLKTGRSHTNVTLYSILSVSEAMPVYSKHNVTANLKYSHEGVLNSRPDFTKGHSLISSLYSALPERKKKVGAYDLFGR